ncbi:hypothetical protein [Streptomyces sp. ST2-7A]|uniref:hypothetical protein n=1 Tax=Streptomyces sp. ST2-7A TaxID=2907214 RepID=UPI001F2E2037|nr:hypothetical protein [Streptomyces sp. ST2-7A]MCE7081135.1 hypothetical protein [Streptomyces sp. ST2-7A]
MTHLTTLTDTHPDFYPTLGPYLANRDVHHEIGGPIWDEPTKTWIIARTGTTITGFIGINQGNRRTTVESLWIAPNAPADTPTHLINAAVTNFGHDRDLHTVVRNSLADTHTKAGFATLKTTRNFTTMVRPATIREAGRD